MGSEGRSSLERWLGRLSPSTAVTARYHMGRFLRWLAERGGRFSGMAPDELVEYQRGAGNAEAYEILDLVQEYVSGMEGRYTYKLRAYSAIRSFFRHNRAPLPSDPDFAIRGDRPRVVGTLTAAEIRDVVLGSRPAYQAIILSMLQGGMGPEEFQYWNLNGWPKLREALRGEPEVVRIDLPGRKRARNRRPYYTLIGGDAIAAIRNWLPHRPPGARAIFTNQYGEPITKNAVKLYWRRQLARLGIIRPRPGEGRGARYGKNLHEIRDVFRSLWEKSPAKASVAEFLMGHVVDPLEYNKAFRDDDWVVEEYLKALPMLQIMSSDLPFGKVNGKVVKRLQDRISELEAQIEAQRRTIEMMMPAFRMAQRILEQREELERLRRAPSTMR